MKNVGNLHWPIELRFLQMPYIEAYMKSVDFETPELCTEKNQFKSES